MCLHIVLFICCWRKSHITPLASIHLFQYLCSFINQMDLLIRWNFSVRICFGSIITIFPKTKTLLTSLMSIHLTVIKLFSFISNIFSRPFYQYLFVQFSVQCLSLLFSPAFFLFFFWSFNTWKGIDDKKNEIIEQARIHLCVPVI